MNEDTVPKLKRVPLFGFFAERSFFHYFWTGGFITALNVFLLWLFIDIWNIPTVISSLVVVGGTFILRYVIFRWLKVM